MLPWVFWSLVFRLVLLMVADDPGKWQLLSEPWSLLVGSSIHLWFLPFVMLAMALIEPCGRLIRSPSALALALGGLVMLSVPLFWLHGKPGLPVPLPQWLVALPVYLLGVTLGLGHHLRRRGWPMLAAMAMGAVAFVLSDGALWSFTIVAAVLVFEAFWRLPLQGRWLPPLGQAAFGIYLVHPFFLLVVYKLLGAGVDRMLAAVLTFMMSWGAVVMLRRIPLFVRLT